MVKIKNTLKKPLSVVGFRKFTAEEKREVTNEEAKILIRNPYLELVEPGTAKKPKKGTEKNLVEITK